MRAPRMTTRWWMISVVVTAVLVKAGIIAESWWRLKSYHASVLRGHQATMKWFDEGRVTLSKTVRSSERLLEAELAMCSTRMQKVTAISTHLKRARQLIERDKQELPGCQGPETWFADIAEAEETLVAWETELKTLNGPN